MQTPILQTLSLKKLGSGAAEALERLKGVGERLGKILTFSPADEAIAPAQRLSVSIEKGRLSVAFGSRFLSRVTVKGAKEYFFEAGKFPLPAELTSSVRLAANEFGAAGTPVILVIPKAWTIIRKAEFPSAVKENLANVVAYELDRLTPFAADDAFFDFKVLGEDGGKINLAIAAANAESVRPYIESLREAGFIVTGITFNLSGLGTLCRLIEDKADILFVELDNHGFEGALFIRGTAVQAFGGDFSSADERDRAGEAAAAVQSAGGTKGSGAVPQIVALFKGKDPAFRELFKSRLHGFPVKIMGETQLKLGLPGPLGKLPHSAVGGVAESLWPRAEGPNLLTRGIREKKKTPMGLTLVLFLAILCVGALYVMAPLRIEEKRMHQIDLQLGPKKKEVAKVEALKKEVEGMEKEISTITGFKESNPLTLNMLKELTTILPKTTWLTRVKVDNSTVQIEGYSDSATGLLPKIEASPYFKKVEFASPTFRDARMNADRFIIKMDIEGIAKPEPAAKEGAGESPGVAHPKGGVKNEKK